MTVAGVDVKENRRLSRQIAHQFRYDLLSSNSAQGRFFAILMPVLFLLLFSSIFRHTKATVPGGTMPEGVYYVPSIMAYGVIAASFMNLCMNVVQYREAGIYKRRRATPVPTSASHRRSDPGGVRHRTGDRGRPVGLGWFTVSAHLPAAPSRLRSYSCRRCGRLLHPWVRARRFHRQR